MKVIAAALLCVAAIVPHAWGQEVTPAERLSAWKHTKETTTDSIALFQASTICHVIDHTTAANAMAGLIADARTFKLIAGLEESQLQDILREGLRKGEARATPALCVWLHDQPKKMVYIKLQARLLAMHR